MVCNKGTVSHAAAGEMVGTPSEQIRWSSVGIGVSVEALAYDIANSLGCTRPMAMHPIFVAPHRNPEPM